LDKSHGTNINSHEENYAESEKNEIKRNWTLEQWAPYWNIYFVWMVIKESGRIRVEETSEIRVEELIN